jgi:hypothetical protein
MTTSRRSPIEDLRLAIDCLPVRTRIAMLDGMRANDIIVGAYSDRQGGICPMLAAHRHGGRTNFISFARAWDRFAGVKRARRADRRELGVLRSHLEASLMADHIQLPSLAEAIADHQSAARGRREREAAATGSWGFLRRRAEAADAVADERADERELERV